MKRNLFWLFSLVALTTLFTVTSCEKDACKDVVCDANSDCFDGECICKVGFEKDASGNCVGERQKFIGSFNATEPDCGVALPYTVEISAVSGTDNKVNMKNLGNYTCLNSSGIPIDYFVEGTVSGNTVTVTNFVTCGTTFNGTGTYNKSGANVTITIPYTATYNPGTGTQTDNCTAILIPK